MAGHRAGEAVPQGAGEPAGESAAPLDPPAAGAGRTARTSPGRTEPDARVRTLSEELLGHLTREDPSAATAHLTSLVDAGVPLAELVDEGLAPAMVEVGARWESARWSVVDEHEATTVAEAALTAAAARSDNASVRGDVVVACAQGDWHSLAARMVAEVLTASGWAVRFLGASQSTTLLLDHVARRRPDAVLLSCAVPTALPGLVASVQGVHQLALPVYVGGRALGGDARRAAAVGADGWAATAADAVRLVERRPMRRDAPDLSARLDDHATRQHVLPAWARAAADLVKGRAPAAEPSPAGADERTVADLGHLLEMASVSLLLDDDSLLSDQCAWLGRVLASRGEVPDAADRALGALREVRPGSWQGLLLDGVLARVQEARRRAGG